MNWKQELLRVYIERGAVSYGQFSLTGGGKSNFYIDGRLVTTTSKGLNAICRGIVDVLGSEKNLKAEVQLVAPAVSGIAIGAALSLYLDTNFVIDRGRAKEHGTTKRFEGIFEGNRRCIIIDDLITAGTTLI